jgi:hypothetical protein
VRWDRLLDRAPWKARAMPRGGQLDGFFYVLTGRAGTGTVFSDVWRSPDGIEWELVTAKAEWGKRCYPEVEIVDGVMVLVAGQDLRTFHNDVWRSTDAGRTWEQVCADAPWGVRAGHHTHVLGEELLLFGGARNSVNRIFYPELWVSADLGETWELRAQLPTDMGRAGMQVVSIDDVLYFMGGDHDRPVFQASWEGRRNDVWRSTDRGETWELLGHAPWTPRTGHQAVVANGVVYVVGGHVRGPRDQRWRQFLAHDVWAWDPVASGGSMAGWRLVDDTAWGAGTPGGQEGKSDFLLEVRDGKLWTFGGDREVLSPWPQDRDVWVADLPID